jgi:hypothetical protein
VFDVLVKLKSEKPGPLVRVFFLCFIPIYAIDPELFDFHQIRFSFGETAEEVIRK